MEIKKVVEERSSNCWKAYHRGTWALLCVTVCSFLILRFSSRSDPMLDASLLPLMRSVGGDASSTRQQKQSEATNKTMLILQQLRMNGSTPCHHVRTSGTTVIGLPSNSTGKSPVSIPTDSPFTFMFISIAANGTARCSGGDYYETQLEGDHWTSRPPVIDHGNGSYSVTILVDRGFPGIYNFTAHLLFDNFHGLDHDPRPWAIIRKVVSMQFLVVVNLGEAKAISAGLRVCKPDDTKVQDGRRRWTRGWFNESCEADGEGRFGWCVAREHERCEEPWCEGRVSLLESNGWVYSGSCGFHLWERDEAWECLSGKWLFFWGDSNMQDYIRNLLAFVLGYQTPSIDRMSDKFYINPDRPDQALRISLAFNGHYQPSGNYLGLDSLRNAEYRDNLLSHFNGSATSPNAFIMNSGLHDGVHFATVEDFVSAVDYAAEFWQGVFASIPSGRKQPALVLRTAVAPAGGSRGAPANPHKMEVLNAVMAEGFRKMGDLHLVDAFDASFPFHYDHSYSDGGHYGRQPNSRSAPWFGKPHQYFVDVMLAHMMLNSLCSQGGSFV